MKTIWICAALVAFASNAGAIDRIRPASMSCSALQGLIQTQGAVILQFPARSQGAPMSYDRYASGNAGCGAEYYPTAATVPTRDEHDCAVLICRTRWGHSR